MACESLSEVSDNTVLEISHLDLLSGVLSYLDVSTQGKKNILNLVSEKNIEGVMAVLDGEGKSDAGKELLSDLISLHGDKESVAPLLNKFALDSATRRATEELMLLLDYLDERGFGKSVCVDFSVVNNTNYYNGIAFRGFVLGAARAVLLGGQYDKLPERMKRTGRAVGFAVYVDELARLG